MIPSTYPCRNCGVDKFVGEYRKAMGKQGQKGRRYPVCISCRQEERTALPRCSVATCERPQFAKTLCGAHYQRVRNGGDLSTPIRETSPRASNFGEIIWRLNDNGYLWGCVEGRNVFQHRWVMERALKRKLRPDETVHHINGIRDDNRIENLQPRVGQHGRGAAWGCGDCGGHNIIPKELLDGPQLKAVS